MANIRADIAGPAQPDLRVHVRAVHIHLSTGVVNDLADVLDGLSNTPRVDGYVIINAARLSLCSFAFAFRSSTSIDPSFAVFTGTTLNPAMTALAGFVPCALSGIRQIFRCPARATRDTRG
jgi:hypothetical protein